MAHAEPRLLLAPASRCAVGGDLDVSTSSTCEVGVGAEGVLGSFQ